MNMDEIINNLFVGDISDTIIFREYRDERQMKVYIIDVTDYGSNPYANCNVPIFNMEDPEVSVETADIHQLDKIADLIEMKLIEGYKVLVHCGAGMERSPTAIIYYLYKYQNMTIDQAYGFVREKHHNMFDRRNWLSKVGR